MTTNLYFFMGPGLLAGAAVIFPVVGAILMVLRMRMKIKAAKSLGIEDWLIVPALALSIGMGIATIIGVASKSVGYAQPPNLEKGFQTTKPIFTRTRAAQNTYVGPRKSIFNVTSIAAIVIMVIWMFGFFLAVMLICPGHVTEYWETSAGRAKYCWPTMQFLYTLCWSDVATDIIVFVMPIPSILKLHLPTRKKFAILGVFAVGAVTVASSIVRAVFYLRLLSAQKKLAATLDPNMINTNGIYWMLVETGLALIVVNLPLLYRTTQKEGVESVIRSVRSFASIVSAGSRSSSKNNRKEATAQKSGRTSDGRDIIELVPVAFPSKEKTKRGESLSDVDLEAGNTKPYNVEKR